MNTYGERVKVTIFGESHGPAIGVVLDGVPAGEAIDMDAVRIQMRRRAPGSSDLTTHRSETDDPLVMSGILNGVTTGAPISAIFRNKDQNSAAYHPEIPRPSHADYAATVRFGGHADPARRRPVQRPAHGLPRVRRSSLPADPRAPRHHDHGQRRARRPGDGQGAEL